MEVTQKQAVKSLRILYPIWMAAGIFSLLYIPSKFITADPAVTAGNILANPLLFKFGIAGGLLTQLFFIFTVIMLFHLFKPVNKVCPMNMMIFALVSVPIAMVSVLGQTAALELAAKDTGLMRLFLDLYEQGLVIASIFWGLWLLPLGNLVRQSGYFPKFIGIALLLAAAGYVFGAFAQLLLADPGKVMPFFDILTLGEMVFIARLVFKGAKLPESQV